MRARSKLILARSGQAMVEFALLIPLLILLLMGVFDAGRAIYAYTVVASAAREGAHYGIVEQNQGCDPPGIIAVAYKNTAALEQSQINVTPQVPSGCPRGGNLSVTVSYTFQPYTLFFVPVTVTGKSTMTIE